MKEIVSGNRKKVFIEGLRDGIPIGLGYLAVAFSLGFTARSAGLTAFQAALTSFLCNASAGEYAGFTVIAADAPYVEMAVMTLVANARYLLMSFALSQKMESSLSISHRLLVGFDVTDELFGIAVARKGSLDPYYSYGAMAVAIPLWALGTALGVIAGNIMPARLVSALSVALYGMFLAIIIPPARKDKILAGIIVLCFAASYTIAKAPAFAGISSGTGTIILTVVISSLAAILFPRKQEEEQ